MQRFRLDGRVIVITGGAGLLGREHAHAIAEAGGIPVLWDLDPARAAEAAKEIEAAWGTACGACRVDITDEAEVSGAVAETLAAHGRVDGLVNNAANNPQVEADGLAASGRLETFDLEAWNRDLAVGLTGAFLCSRAVGMVMAANGGGVILNVASDLGVIAPDQRLYRVDGNAADAQPVKPVTYSVTKHGLIGLTKYLSTYWNEQGVRVNALAPGGVFTNQPDDFVTRLSALIPMGRMASSDEYRGAVQFLCSDASSYMTGACLVADGGRSVW